MSKRHPPWFPLNSCSESAAFTQTGPLRCVAYSSDSLMYPYLILPCSLSADRDVWITVGQTQVLLCVPPLERGRLQRTDQVPPMTSAHALWGDQLEQVF